MDRASGDGRLAGGPELDGSLVSRSCELEDVSFGAVLEVDGHPRVQWSTPHGLEAAGCGVAMRFETSGPDRFETVRSAAADRLTALEHDGAPASRPRAFGGLSFHNSYDRDHGCGPAEPWQGFAGASFVVPRVQVTRTDDGTWLTVVAENDAAAADGLEAWRTRFASLPSMRPSGSAPGIDATRWTTDREAWTDGVETALERIETGDLEKVVLALSLTADLETSLDVAATLERLRRRYPDCYRFMIDRGDDGIFFGAPPERLVAVHDDRVETEALAGSVPRGKTPAEDGTLVDRLCDSEKFQHEHRLVAETIRDQLEPLSSEVSVGERTVRRLATIQHLQTPIEATLSTDRHVLELVEALHPTPAVGGLPLSAAFETIREVECFDRGWYAAPVGWFDADGNGEFAVGIRSGVATDDAVTLFAGNGIVADSDPGEEWEEVQLKFRPILDELR